MSGLLEKIIRYYQAGYYTAGHLEKLAQAGALSQEQVRRILSGEQGR